MLELFIAAHLVFGLVVPLVTAPIVTPIVIAMTSPTTSPVEIDYMALELEAIASADHAAAVKSVALLSEGNL